VKSLSSALSAALGAPVQRPAVLVQMDFTLTRRWSSFQTITWSGQTWTKQALHVDGLQVQPLLVRGTLVLANTDGTLSNLVLSEGVQDRVVRIWGYDAGATAAPDVVWLADAVGASAEISPSSGEVRISLRHRAELVQSPRVYVTRAAGFEQLLPAGTAMRINGIDFILERP
jgi:hypothetical protein